MAQTQLVIEDDDAARVGERIMALAKEDALLREIVSNNNAGLSGGPSRQGLVTLGRSIVIGIIGAGAGN